MEKRISLKDVAREAGVSTALVSYVLNGKENRVGAATITKVRKAAARLRYRPNLLAKSLQSGKTNTIGLMVADIANPFFSRIAKIVEEAAGHLGYTVIFGSTSENAATSLKLTEALCNRQVDGLIIAPAAATLPQLKALQKRGVPFVLIDRYFEGPAFTSIRIDNYAAGFQATEHLILGGNKRIAFINYREAADNQMPHFTERLRGYRAACTTHKIKAEVISIAYGKVENEMKEAVAMIQKKKLDAVFFATHTLAIEGLKEISRLHIRVPEELAIVSFDQHDAFDLYQAPVSFIRQPLVKIGDEAVRLLIDLIDNIKTKHQSLVLDAELVVRKSSGGS